MKSKNMDFLPKKENLLYGQKLLSGPFFLVGIKVEVAVLFFALFASATARAGWADENFVNSEGQRGQDDNSNNYLIHAPLLMP
jgi:hypothetical protein